MARTLCTGGSGRLCLVEFESALIVDSNHIQFVRFGEYPYFLRSKTFHSGGVLETKNRKIQISLEVLHTESKFNQIWNQQIFLHRMSPFATFKSMVAKMVPRW